MKGIVRRGLAASALASAALIIVPGRASAGDGPPAIPGARLSSDGLKSVEPAAPSGAKAGPIASALTWYSIPRRARDVAKTMAKSEKAAITRCVATEQDAQVSYEVHASHRKGLLRRDDFVLINLSEPKGVADKRKEERSLRGRWEKRKRERAEFKNPKTVKYEPHDFGGSK